VAHTDHPNTSKVHVLRYKFYLCLNIDIKHKTCLFSWLDDCKYGFRANNYDSNLYFILILIFFYLNVKHNNSIIKKTDDLIL
jgi:hypothetical protein